MRDTVSDTPIRFADVALLHVNPQVGHCPQQLRIERTDPVAADVVGIPWLVVVARRGSECGHDAVEIMPVFQCHVLVNELEAQRLLFGTQYCHDAFSGFAREPSATPKGTAATDAVAARILLPQP